MMAKKIKKIMAMVLALCICFSALPLQALAAEGDGTVETTEDGVKITTTTTTTETQKDPATGDTTVTITIQKDSEGTKTSTGEKVDGSETKVTVKEKDSDGNEKVMSSETNSTTTVTDENGKKVTTKVEDGYERTETEVPDSVKDVTVEVSTKTDNPATEEHEGQNVATTPTDPTKEPEIKGDEPKGEDDKNYNYTETTEEAGKVTVTTTGVKIEEKVDKENTDLEYVSSDTTPTDNNDLVYADGAAPEEYQPGYEGDTKIPGKVDGYEYVYVGSGNTSKIVPAIVFTDPMTDEEKLAKWGDYAYISSNAELWVNFLPNPDVAARDAAGKLVKDEQGYILDKEGNRILKAEFSAVGPDGKTYYTQRIDNLGEAHFVEGWYVDGEWKAELNAPADTDENGNPIKKTVQLVDKDGNPVTDADGNPVYVEVGKVNAWKNATVDGKYISGPLGGFIKDADGNYKINYMAVWAGPQQFVLVDSEGNTITTYCADLTTPTEDAYGYNVENLEDATYYDEEAAKMIRSIAKNGYWGTSSDEGSLEYMKQKMLESGKFKEEELASLTDGVALTATQMAIWSCSNKMSGVEFINAHYSNWGTGNVPKDKEDEVKLLFKLYDYLTNLAPSELEGTTRDTIINADNFIEGMEVTVVEKAKGHENNKDKNKDNDAYVTNLTFALVVEVDENNGDNLKVSVVDGNGNPILNAEGKPVVGRIAGALEEGEIQLVNNNGNYCFENIVLTEGANTFKLNLEGIQNLQEGVYLYSSEVRTDAETGEEVSSQTMVGLAGGKRGVSVSMDLKFELDVKDKVVVKEHYWHSEKTNTNPPGGNVPPQGPNVPPQEPPQVFNLNREGVVEIIDEQVPLAAAPKTGDASFLFIALALFAAISLCAANFDKKRKHEAF